MPFDAATFDHQEMAVLQRLREGRERVKRGWCQFVGHLVRGGLLEEFCALGALIYDGSEAAIDELARRAMAVLRAHLPPQFEDVQSFNDHIFTERSDVVALYDRAIAAMEARAELALAA